MAIKINNVTVIDDSKKIIPSSIEANSTVGTAGSVLTSTGSGLEWVPPTGGGGLTLISSVNADNSSSVAFTSGITTAYDSYVIYGYNIVGVATTSLFTLLLAGFSTNSGSSYISTDYYYTNSVLGAFYGEEALEIPIPGFGLDGCIISPYIGVVYGTLFGGSSYPVNFVWHLHNLSESGDKPRHSSVQSYCGIGSTTVGAGYFHVGLGASTSPINAIEFSFIGYEGGSIDIVSGNFRLCGINNS